MVRSPQEPITRARIVALALELADRDGLGAASFRRLGEELGVTPMALYHHVRDKADLLAEMIELVLAEVELPPRPARWADDLRAVVRSFLAAARRHPCTADLLTQGAPALSPHVLRLTEGALDLLHRAGFAPGDAIAVLQQLSALITSRAAIGGPPRSATSATSNAGAAPPAPGAAWAGIPRDGYPRMREAVAHLGRWDSVEDLGIDMLVHGVEGLLRQRRREARSRKRRR